MPKNSLDVILSGEMLTRDQHLDCMREYHDQHTDWSERYFSRPSEIGKSSYAILRDSIGIPARGDFRILDLGCGAGTFSKQLDINENSNLVYVGIDISEKCVKFAEQRLANAQVRFEVSAADQLPFGDESFDAVVSHMAFSMFKPIDVAAKEAFRVLKYGGIFSVILPAVWSPCSQPNLTLDSGIREIIKGIFPNYTKNYGGFGEPEFFSKAGIEKFLSNYSGASDLSIDEFEVDFSGSIDDVLWGIKTFYWYQILSEELKFSTEKKLIELLEKVAGTDGCVRHHRKLALLKCRKI